ncbi:MAG: hypothetical protein QOH06_3352 [Acidobacteriota bacterium]|jgi:hypothetical protein|nr:hypothetical protein [Acidobacteriota bacterium]
MPPQFRACVKSTSSSTSESDTLSPATARRISPQSANLPFGPLGANPECQIARESARTHSRPLRQNLECQNAFPDLCARIQSAKTPSRPLRQNLERQKCPRECQFAFWTSRFEFRVPDWRRVGLNPGEELQGQVPRNQRSIGQGRLAAREQSRGARSAAFSGDESLRGGEKKAGGARQRALLSPRRVRIIRERQKRRTDSGRRQTGRSGLPYSNLRR